MNLERTTLLLLLLSVIALPACGGAPEPAPPPRGAYLGQTPPGTTPELFAPGIVSTRALELNAVFTPDGNELYFTRLIDNRETLMTTRRLDGAWTPPAVADFSGAFTDVDPFITRDGRRLYFSSSRPVDGSGESKDADLWYLERQAGGGWGEPVHLGEPNTEGKDDYYTSLSDDGTLYFSIFESKNAADIYRAARQEGGFGPAERVAGGISTEALEHDPLVAPDGSYLIFTSDRPGGYGSADLYISFAGADGSWTEPVNMGESINSANYEFCAMLSPDGEYLFFTSRNDIYWVDARVIEGLRPAGADRTEASAQKWPQDWPQWRGPGRDGQAPNPLSGGDWPAALEKEWAVEVGIGYSSPLVSGDSVYIFTRRDEEETLTALSLGSGRVLWRASYAAPYRVSSAARDHGKGPKSTPALSGGRIFTLGISGILSAFDAATGETIWRHDFGGRFGETSPSFGASMSPIVDGDRLFAHVGGSGDGAVLALDAATGEEIWSWAGAGPGYASPVIAEISGVRQLITQVETAVVGIDLETGRLLWNLPFETPWVQNVVTPVVEGDLLIYSGLDQGITAVRPTRSGNGWALDEAWSTTAASLYMSSPVVVGDRLCGFSHLRKGQHFCLSTADGELLWASKGRDGDNAALLTAGEWVFALTTDAQLIVYPAAAEQFAPVAGYEVATSPTWAHPVILPGRVLVKDELELTAYRVP